MLFIGIILTQKFISIIFLHAMYIVFYAQMTLYNHQLNSSILIMHHQSMNFAA